MRITGTRFSIRWLMVVVLVAGLVCGLFARWYSRELRRQALVPQLHVQQQVTDLVIHEIDAEFAANRKALSVWSGDAFGNDMWTAQLNAYESQDGRKKPRVSVAVSGGCDGDVLRPITIKTVGASMEGPVLDRLITAYRVQGWTHEVVTVPTADK
jgi:hypothetical protein